jgi:mycothiol synthase
MHHVQVITRLRDEQVEQLEELIAAAREEDGHEPLGEHKFLRLRQGDDLALAFLALDGSKLVGYAQTLTWRTDGDRRVSCEMVVHPRHRRQGVGAQLMAAVIERSRADGASRLDFWAYNDAPASRAVAHRFGLRVSRRLLHMHRHPEDPPIEPAPPGVLVRPFRPGEEEMLLRLNNTIFAGHPENGAWTMADLAARMAQPWFQAEDLLILEAWGRPSGFCWLKVEERGEDGLVGEIYVIGTLPEYHGRGFGRYLLSQGLRRLAERGVDTVAVYTDMDNARAVTLYWSFGFHHHHVDVCYSLALAPGAQAPPAAP